MPDARARLLRCFSAVFPKLSEPNILASNIVSTIEWDSLATVNLFAVVEEEFGIEIQIEEIENLVSFESFHKCVSVDTTVS